MFGLLLNKMPRSLVHLFCAGINRKVECSRDLGGQEQGQQRQQKQEQEQGQEREQENERGAGQPCFELVRLPERCYQHRCHEDEGADFGRWRGTSPIFGRWASERSAHQEAAAE